MLTPAKDLEYQDGDDELQNLITEITAMRDPGLFMSVGLRSSLRLPRKWHYRVNCKVYRYMRYQHRTRLQFRR